MGGGGFIDSGFGAEGRGGGGGGGGLVGAGFGTEGGGIGAAILRALGSTAGGSHLLSTAAGGSHLQPSSSRLLNSNLHRTASLDFPAVAALRSHAPMRSSVDQQRRPGSPHAKPSRGGVEQKQLGKSSASADTHHHHHHHHHHRRRVLQIGEGGGSSPLQKVGSGGANLLDAYLSVPGKHVPSGGARGRGGGGEASYRRHMSGPADAGGLTTPSPRGTSSDATGCVERNASGPPAEAV